MRRLALNLVPRSKAACVLFSLLFFCVPGAVAVPARPSLAIHIPNRFISAGSDSAFVVEISNAGQSPSSVRASLASNLRVDFPGFVPRGEPVLTAGGEIRVEGHLPHPGFFPFQVSLRLGNETLTAQDYFVSLSEETPPTFDHLGYYVFLGRGDYWNDTHKLALWRLEDWEDLVDWMSAHKMDTLYMLLNGYTLAYPSEKYPSLRDPYSVNVQFNFLRKLIPYAHRHHVRIFLTMTTDDHAQGFGKLHPEATRINRDGQARSARALDLENPLTQRYVADMFEEALALYPDADGIVIHPTESDPDRFNDDTRAAFLRDTGRKLSETDKAERYRWYNEKYAEFASKLYRLAIQKNPKLEIVMFNCWWQDDYVSIYKRLLPEKVKICVWYYGWDDRDFRKWAIWRWTEEFGSPRISYMPAGVAFEYPQDAWQQMIRHIGTDRLISTAEALGVKSCIFFDGWDLGTESDRLRDMMIAEFPTTSYVRGQTGKLELLKKLYENYFLARKEVLR